MHDMVSEEIEYERNQKIACILDIGEMLLANGADVNRVEDTIRRLSDAFDFSDCQVHAINSSIIVTMTSLDGTFLTQARRISHIDTDLNKVSELNNLSRKICAGTPDMDMLLREMERIRNTSVYSPFMLYLGYIISAVFRRKLGRRAVFRPDRGRDPVYQSAAEPF